MGTTSRSGDPDLVGRRHCRPTPGSSSEGSGADDSFDTADPDDLQVGALRDLWDPFTFRRLGETGIGEGWCCLEIGAGTGSVAAWLADRVGPDGQVVVTGVGTRWLDPTAAANLQVRHHSRAGERLDEGFDLIHVRLVLGHLPERAAVAAELVRALKPGGWLVIEDHDLRSLILTDPPLPSWELLNHAILDVLRASGADPIYGSRLPKLLRSFGLADVTVEGSVRPTSIPDLAPVFRPALEQLRQPLLSSGAVTSTDLQHALDAFDDRTDPPHCHSPILVSAAGRRPMAGASP